MAWVLLEATTPELGLLANGSIEWNSVLQAKLGDPVWVRLLWDAEARQLGVRINYISEGFPVYSELDKGEYKIDSADVMEAAGISVEDNYSAEPVRTSEPVVGPDAALYNPEPVWYITLPE